MLSRRQLIKWVAEATSTDPFVVENVLNAVEVVAYSSDPCLDEKEFGDVVGGMSRKHWISKILGKREGK